ncbi:hypothetical protein [Streptomyces sp. AC602_WCS936]|uniref:hypothetical protein n=1 Tax=Streptomyces sp. AC602_WCS936 TaxID=2823685 RepID=UPI001C2654EF|nr:hypothetical protein [Streptomyces sp. AC602_WCS936]
MFLWLILALAAPVTPFAVVGAAVVLAWRLRAGLRREGWHRPSGTTCAQLAFLGGAAALGAYGHGAARGYYILDPDQLCASYGVQGEDIVTRLTLTVSVRCVTGDGAGTEVVPGWVNPVVLAGLTLLVLAVAEAIHGAVRRWRAAGSSSGR